MTAVMTLRTEEQVKDMLNTPLEELIRRADSVREQFTGRDLELCSILSARSGRCSEDCSFCAQSCFHSSESAEYPLVDPDRITEAAGRAQQARAGRFGIVTSGNRLSEDEVDIIADAVSTITSSCSIQVCGSLGALTRSQIYRLKSAGMTRYHHNIETSRRYYPHVVTTHDYDQRLDTISSAHEAGMDVCSGGIIGMGENWQDRIDMAVTLQELGVVSVPLNILIPLKGTPLEDIGPLPPEDIIRTVCLFRLILKDVTLKLAAGRESALGEKQIRGFEAGANGMIIGGYLTVNGRPLEEDYRLIEEIKSLWNGC